MVQGNRQALLLHLLALGLGVLLLFALTLGLPDAAYSIAGGYATSATLSEIRAALHLDDPLPVRFFLFWRDLLTGDLRSFYNGEALVPVLLAKLRVTGGLLVATCVALGVLTAGWLVAYRAVPRLLPLVDLAAGISAAVPLFITATLLLFLSTILGIPGGHAAAVALALFPSLLLSTNLNHRLHALRARPYHVLAAHYRLRRRYAMHRALRELAPTLAILINALIFFLSTGFAVVETIFGLPGFGRWMLESIVRVDLPVIFLTGVVIAIGAALLFFIGHLLQRWADPGQASGAVP